MAKKLNEHLAVDAEDLEDGFEGEDGDSDEPVATDPRWDALKQFSKD